MRVLFVDVGQGTCQIILLGGRRAIVIDAGSAPGTALRTLRLLKMEIIELLVVSHSHIDHSGGAARRHRLQYGAVSGILADYCTSIEKVAYVFDSQMRNTAFGQYLVKLLKDQKLRKEQLQPITASNEPQLLWQSGDAVTRLAAISPLGGDQLLAFDAGNPNASSAILELRHRGEKIVFSADSEFDQWREVYRLRNNSPVICKALTMPHHGGLMNGSAEDLRWFCNEATYADIVVVSVATINQHGHPREEVIRAIAASGTHVICTQITDKCCSDLEGCRPGVIGSPVHPCRSSSNADWTTSARRSKNVACAGTVSALLSENGISIERIHQHISGIDKLVAAGNSPLCRGA